MNILQQYTPEIKHQHDILGTLDLVEHMIGHHQDQALELVELALWHEQQAQALEAERRALAADVTEVLRQAEEVLR